jgi:hypothetical protein
MKGRRVRFHFDADLGEFAVAVAIVVALIGGAFCVAN